MPLLRASTKPEKKERTRMASAAREREISPLLRRPEVERLTGLCKSAIYEQMAAGKFPQPRRISTRCVAWVSSEIDQWIAERPLR